MNSKQCNTIKQQPVKREKYDLITCDSVCCRTCLRTDNLVPIFNGYDEEKKSRNLKIVTGLVIKRNDGLSQDICYECLDIFHLMLQFRHRSKKAEKILVKALITPVDIACNIKIEPDISITTGENEQSYSNVNTQYANNGQNDDGLKCEDAKTIYIRKEETRTTLNMSTSMEDETSGAPYKCKACTKEFRTKTTYSDHVRMHTSGRVCESCGKQFRNDSKLKQHMRAWHGLSRIHKCAYCDYNSATKQALVVHIRRHTGERPYICDHCGASFHRRANLVQHIAIHLPEKNFQCSYCSLRLKSKKRLQIHISDRHRDSRFSHQCPSCQKIFIRKVHVHRHLLKIHHIPREDHPPIERVMKSEQT